MQSYIIFTGRQNAFMFRNQRYQVSHIRLGWKAALVLHFHKATLLIKLIFLSLSSLLTRPVFGWDWIDFFQALDIVEIAVRKKKKKRNTTDVYGFHCRAHKVHHLQQKSLLFHKWDVICLIVAQRP